MNTCKAKPWKNLGLVINSRSIQFSDVSHDQFSDVSDITMSLPSYLLIRVDYNVISLVDAMGTRFTKDVKIVGLDPDNDLTVLKIETEGRELKPVALGTSSDLCVGQSCLTCLLSLKLWRIISRLMTVTTKVGLSSRACLMFMAT
ncbi:hypothetical protein Bca4012_004513 [Brassica carinata]